jgi:hypothetical protein
VVPAAEHPSVAGLGLYHLRAAVAAAVDENPHLVVFAAHQDNGRTTYWARLVVAWLWYLALVSNIDPGPMKNPVNLQFEDGLICVGARMDAAISDERLQILMGYSVSAERICDLLHLELSGNKTVNRKNRR